MKFLLSNGTSTLNIIEYISDVFYINLNIYSTEIPYSKTGVLTVIGESDEETVISLFKSSLGEIISSLTSKFPGLEISLVALNVQDNHVKASISINNVIKNYEVQGSN